MRYLTILSLLLFYLNLSSQTNYFEKGAEYCAYNKLKKSNLIELNISSPQPKHSFDVLDYKLDLDIYNCFLSPYPKSFSGEEIITFRVDSTLNSIQLNASNSSLIIDQVGLAGTSFVHGSNILTINLNRLYYPGEIVQLKIKYRHLNVSDGAFYVSNGFVFTDCEPEGARNWFPCWDKPSDKATWNLRAKTPAPVKLGSNGRLADSVKIGDTIYYNWISRDPIATYLMVISARVNYNLDIIYWTRPSTQELIPIRFYYNPGESVASIKPKVLQMMNYYSNLFGEHQFEKNGFATLNSQFAWGGMENQTLTSLCPNCWSENLISHEFAHQWFGDMITCATWADIWLNEGFATYCEALWYEYTQGYSRYKSDINSNASYYLSYNPGWPIYNPSWAITTPDVNTLFNVSITYYKSACVLHMLRYTLGDSVFFRLLKTYGSDSLRFRNKSITTQDFINLVNEVAGKDMNWFFNQWLFAPNHPVYQNYYSISSAGNGKWYLAFTAKQVQTNTVFFKMPITLKISFSNGTDTLIRVINSYNNQTFGFLFDRQPISLIFDPQNDIVLKQGSTTQNTINCRSINVTSGWNLVSLPLISNNFSPNEVFPQAVSNAYGFEDGYYQVDSMVLGKGYWLKFLSNESIAICGNLSPNNYVQVKRGWNLIGVYDRNINVNAITSTPEGIIETPFYGYNNGYSIEDLLIPGKGYWVKVNQNGNISFNTTSKSSDLSFKKLVENFDKIKIIDKNGFEFYLYITNSNLDLDYFELPPQTPEGIPDVRFASNRLVECIDNSPTMLLNSLSFPITVQLISNKNGLNKFLLVDELTNVKYEIENDNVILIKQKSPSLKLIKELFPSRFEIFQNYPNPFNSETTLEYIIPSEGVIQITVYNAIGEKVIELPIRKIATGTYREKISFSELSAGMYFIQVKFNNDFRIIKSIYLK